ncbi:MAG TPA: hypothetical protein VNO31_01895 [Umezawaea sp.]|nr:hypothetical protein [Umezawaea sp.]
MEEVSGAFSALFEEGRAAEAIADLENLVRLSAGTAHAGLLRTCLAYALAARTVVARGVTRDGALVVLEPAQRTTCLRSAEQIVELATGDVEVERFATDLLDRLRAGETWQWSGELSIAPAVLVFGVLPVVAGALTHLVPLVVFGVLAGTAAVYALVLVNRKQRWQVDARAVRPVVGRFGS